MKEIRCPFCWDNNVKHIDNVEVRNQGKTRALMECDSCEKYYWDDTKEKISGLSKLCKTLQCNPEKCDEDIRNAKISKNSNHDRRKKEEFDLLCGFCSHRKFFLNSKRKYLNI